MEIIFDDRALVLRGETKVVLLLSDIHLGFEVELDERGVSFPPQHPQILERILQLKEKYSAQVLYIIGDVKHTISADSHFNWQIIPEFMEDLSSRIKTIVVPGNHDGNLEALLPRSVILTDVHGTIFQDGEDTVGLIHGHAWPSSEVLNTRIMVKGHNHPTLRNIRRVAAPEIGRSERIRSSGVMPVILRSIMNKNCVRMNIGLDATDDAEGTLITLPSFNVLFGGVPINRPETELYGPLFENRCVNLLGSEVFSIQGIFLGTVEALRVRSQRND